MGWLGLALLLRSLWAASVVSRNDTAPGALLVDAVL